jgi:cobalt-zinc-cadmium efflux system protein
VHVWTLTRGFVALSGHGVLDEPAKRTRVLEEVRARMSRFGIEHVTFQLEQRPLYQLAKEAR